MLTVTPLAVYNEDKNTTGSPLMLLHMYAPDETGWRKVAVLMGGLNAKVKDVPLDGTAEWETTWVPLQCYPLGNYQIVRIAGDSLIRNIEKSGKPDENNRRRTSLHIESAVLAGAEMVIIACSSISEVAKEAQ